MRISVLGIGAIASILSINAYATSSTVTSRDYVDAQDALKQDKIVGHLQYAMDSVITDSTNDGVVDKRLVLGSANYFTTSSLANLLISGQLTQNPSGQIQEYVEDGEFSYDDLRKSLVQANVLEYALDVLNARVNLKRMTCAQYIDGATETPENCLLWNVLD